MRNSLITLLLFLAMPLAGLSKTYIVCVGIADYPGTRNDLKASANDAKTIARIFENNGDAEILLYIDNRAESTRICEGMLSLYQKAKKEDAVVFFFAGHGVPGAFVFYDKIVRYQVIIDLMNQSKAKRKIVMADTCFSGKMRKGNRQTEEKTSKKVMFFLSSRTSEYSMELRKAKNGLFTTYLERGLRGGADADCNRIITARELFDFVYPRVIENSKEKQHPVMWGNFDKDMEIIKW